MARFTAFLAVFAGSLQLLGSFGLRFGASTKCDPETPSNDVAALEAQTPEPEASEEQPLLRKVHAPIPNCPQDESLSALIKDSHFWILAFAVLLTLGSVSDHHPVERTVT